MKMNTEQYAVWEQAVKYAGKHYNDLIYFLDCLDSADKYLNRNYYMQGWFYTVFPEFTKDTRRFVRVWLGDEPIEVED
jgi:hypothetical protein